MKDEPLQTRRTVLKTLGGMSAVVLLRCGSSTEAPAGGGGNGCVLNPTIFRGPFWVDERLNRSDVTTDTNNRASPNPRPGVPLAIQFAVSGYDSGICTPLQGAQVDIWHVDPYGFYSGIPAHGTEGQNFLRGYQVTDARGVVAFTSIYPGWYLARTVHIHVKVRLFDASSNTTTEATTQVFFDDAISNAVYQLAPYSARPNRDATNTNDSGYTTQMLLNLQGNTASGYTGTVPLIVRVGAIDLG